MQLLIAARPLCAADWPLAAILLHFDAGDYATRIGAAQNDTADTLLTARQFLRAVEPHANFSSAAAMREISLLAVCAPPIDCWVCPAARDALFKCRLQYAAAAFTNAARHTASFTRRLTLDATPRNTCRLSLPQPPAHTSISSSTTIRF